MTSDNQGESPPGEGTGKESVMTSSGGRKEVRTKGPAESDMTIVTKVNGTSIVSAGEGSMDLIDTIKCYGPVR
jgi:hypothetical protein